MWGRYTPRARAIFNLPGYVDDGLLAAAHRFALPDEERDLDVSYRGRPLPPHMGAGSQEKRVIGERFKELAAATSLRVDIETSEVDRLYGDAWYRLLGRSRATLGVESGVSFMDLEDECHADYLRYRQEGRDPTLEELQAGALGRWDGNIPYRTLGPRHFEAAAFRICQVLFEGEYSGAMAPMVHYVPLAKDFSNFDEVVAIIEDPQRRRQHHGPCLRRPDRVGSLRLRRAHRARRSRVDRRGAEPRGRGLPASGAVARRQAWTPAEGRHPVVGDDDHVPVPCRRRPYVAVDPAAAGPALAVAVARGYRLAWM